MRKYIGGKILAGGKKYDLGNIEDPFQKFQREFYFAAMEADASTKGAIRFNAAGKPMPLSEMSEHCLAMIKSGLLEFSRLGEKKYRDVMMSSFLSRLATTRDGNGHNDKKNAIWPLCMYELD